MKRIQWFARSLVAALAGLLIALGHALYLGVTAPNPGAYLADAPFRLLDGSQEWVVVPASAFGVRQYGISIGPGEAWNALNPLGEGTVPEWLVRPTAGQSAISRGFGWPWVALSGTEVYAGGRLVSTPGYLVRNSADLVPVRIRPGLFANGLMWGVLAFIVLATVQIGVSGVRRRLRDMRGQCIHCGYPRVQQAGGVCPECGKVSK